MSILSKRGEIMSVLISKNTRLLVQGITGSAAKHHTKLMRQYGTNIVAGVRPGAGGQIVENTPVYNTVEEAVKQTGANAAILFVPAHAMKQACFEAMDNKIPLIVMVSEHVPLHDTMEMVAAAKINGSTLIGPNTPGIIAPNEKCKIGFVPSQYYLPGAVGVASRSGTLTYEIVSRLTLASIGQSTCVGIGGDPIVGTSFSDMLKLFQNDSQTQACLVIGEVGGSMEEEVAAMVKENIITKPVIAFIAGRTAPEGKKMGHAGAIIARGKGSINSKLNAFKAASIPVAEQPSEVVELVKRKIRQ